MTEIVKVQRPLNMVERKTAQGSCLVYAQGRKNQRLQSVPDDVWDAMWPDERAYFEAAFERGKWTIGKRVEAQGW